MMSSETLNIANFDGSHSLYMLLYSNMYICADIECKETVEGTEYRRTKSTTVSGKTCQAWNTQAPHQLGSGRFSLSCTKTETKTRAVIALAIEFSRNTQSWQCWHWEINYFPFNSKHHGWKCKLAQLAIYFHLKLYRNANITNLVYYRKTRMA